MVDAVVDAAAGRVPDPRRSVAQYLVDREIDRERREGGTDLDDGTRAELPEVPRAHPDGPARGVGRMADRGRWVDRMLDEAVARGEFEDLPLAGKPIPGLTRHDPDWWLRSLVEREQITGVLPEALQLRTDDARLDARLDEEAYEPRVREVLEEFNARVVEARRQLLGGPPVVTPLRDVEREVARWRQRRAAR
ncbi:DUF1992 domain-containing protein [Cellulomonas marina]|uniref:DnaJ family domain-containing protein n=1 Tax=Cellulomonas marina TaxID=988821 RepID=UPI001EF16E0C|nr:DUF1992 domain-containing protein [Cellulomonas marina]